jgi:decaprenylphospho-beta-D-erythro-pentofuranosid-2-ulose 2-reductase
VDQLADVVAFSECNEYQRDMKFQRVLVVGASSGIGAALVRALSSRGSEVAAVARRESELGELAAECANRVHTYCHDVRDTESVPIVFDRVIEDLGGLDLVIYAAGVMPDVEESEYNTVKDQAMVEINFMGAIAWLNLAACHMEARGAGTLVGISSVAGDRGRRGNPVYTASKAALSAYLEALRNRLSRYGVCVITVKPGPVDTPMTHGTQQPLLISTDRCVEGILALVDRQKPVTGYIPGIWRTIMTIIRLVPSFVFRRTNI